MRMMSYVIFDVDLLSLRSYAVLIPLVIFKPVFTNLSAIIETPVAGSCDVPCILCSFKSFF